MTSSLPVRGVIKTLGDRFQLPSPRVRDFSLGELREPGVGDTRTSTNGWPVPLFRKKLASNIGDQGHGNAQSVGVPPI